MNDLGLDDIVAQIQPTINRLQRVLQLHLELRDSLRALSPEERVLLKLQAVLNETACEIEASVASDHRRDASEAAAVKDLVGKSVVEAAIAVLRNRPGYTLHTSEIASEAWRRGYTGRPGATERTAKQTFAVMLKRHVEAFEPVSRGIFRLRPEYVDRVI